MYRVTRFFSHRWRVFFVLAMAGTAVGAVGTVNFSLPPVLPVTAVGLVGIDYRQVGLSPHNRQLDNASVHALHIHTLNEELNSAINAKVDAKVAAFTAKLPPPPTVKGFYYQLRVIPRVDYSDGKVISVTLQSDEYHPLEKVTSEYESWLTKDGSIEQPELDTVTALQLAKVLQVPQESMLKYVGITIAYGLLPDYKVRLYASGPLASRITAPYMDISLMQLNGIARKYQDTFFKYYPARLSSAVQLNLEKGFGNAVSRASRPVDCSVDSCVALTFDDGPDPILTPKVLDTLKKEDVKATFFVQGKQVKNSPAVTERISAEGHEVENHTFEHPDLVRLHDDALIRKQIDDTQNALINVGIKAKFLRPPYGSVDDTVRKTANMPIILWNVDAQEWRPDTTPQSIAASIVDQARPGAIILMHDTELISEAALPIVIKSLQEREFKFVTVEQLLQIDGNARGDFASR